MNQVRRVTLLLFVLIGLGLSGCNRPTSPDDADADFWIGTIGQRGDSGYTVTGGNWKAGSKVSVQIWNEPTGPGAATSQWKKMFEATVDASGMFGFNTSEYYPVKRTICGTPPPGQTALIMVKSLSTNRIRIKQAPVDIYFTFKPC